MRLAIGTDHHLAQAAVVEDLLAAKVKVLPVIVKGKVYALRGVQSFREHGHAQTRTAVNVLLGSRGKQAEPRRGALRLQFSHRTYRRFARREHRCTVLTLTDLKPFVGDGVPAVPDRVGLQIGAWPAVYQTFRYKCGFGHDAALHADGQDAGCRVVV